MTQRFEAPTLDEPPMTPSPALTKFLEGFKAKCQQAFRDLEDVHSAQRPGGNIYALTAPDTTEVVSVSGTSTSTATSTDPALYQLVRELKHKGLIR